MLNNRAVSEVIGAIVLVGMVMLGVALVWLLLFSSPAPTKVPVLDTVISNRSKAIYILHKGGDPLRAGEYQIFVDGGDQTGNFTFLGSGTEPWSVGETLYALSPTVPKRIVILFNLSGGNGGGSVLAVQDLVGTRTVAAPSDIVWYQFTSSGKCLWQARKSITIDGSKVSGTLSSFPLLVSLTDADLAASAQSNGLDILFTASDGTTKLSHEIENYTSATGALIAWVKIPSLPAGTNTVIYMYYGNATVGDQQDRVNVWNDGGSNYYQGVWHLKEAGSGVAGEYVDSTQYVNGGQGGGAGANPVPVAGIAYQAENYDNINDKISVAAVASVNDIFGSDGTVSAWIYPTGLGENNDGRIGDKASGTTGQNGWCFGTYTNNVLMFRKGFGGTRGYWNTSPGSITLNTWNYVAVAYNQGNIANDPTIYINGVPVAFLEASTPAGAVQSDAANTLVLGNRPGQGRTFAGIIDELRASKTIRSAAWIATEYANQASPSTFCSVGSTEQGYWKC
jgi:hypothetical protein